jgi:hypothetical protein
VSGVELIRKVLLPAVVMPVVTHLKVTACDNPIGTLKSIALPSLKVPVGVAADTTVIVDDKKLMYDCDVGAMVGWLLVHSSSSCLPLSDGTNDVVVHSTRVAGAV